MVFDSVVKDNDAIFVSVGGSEQRRLLRVNGVSAEQLLALAEGMKPKGWEASFEKDLPQLLSLAQGTVSKVSTLNIVCEKADGSEEVCEISSVDPLILEAVKKNFEGIIAVGKVGGLSEGDLAALLRYCLLEFSQSNSDHGEGPMGMNSSDMAGIMGHMANAGINPPSCDSQ